MDSDQVRLGQCLCGDVRFSARGFCGRCGTPVSYGADRFPGEIHLYISAFEDPEELPADRHVYFDEGIRWFHIADDLPRR